MILDISAGEIDQGGSYTPVAGEDRVVVYAWAACVDAGTSFVNVTIGGVTATTIISDQNPNETKAIAGVAYILESQIPVGALTMSVNWTGGTPLAEARGKAYTLGGIAQGEGTVADFAALAWAGRTNSATVGDVSVGAGETVITAFGAGNNIADSLTHSHGFSLDRNDYETDTIGIVTGIASAVVEDADDYSYLWSWSGGGIGNSAVWVVFAVGGDVPVSVGEGTLSAGASSISGSGSVFSSISGSGTLAAQAVAIAGSGVVLNVRNLVLTQAQGRELRDEGGTPVELNGIIYEWYDDPDSTEGEPADSGTFNTNENGEATVVLSNSSLTDGHVGGLLLIHPSDPTIRGYYRVPVTLSQ